MAIFLPGAFEKHCHVCFECFSLCVEYDVGLRNHIEFGKHSEGLVFIGIVPLEDYTCDHPCDCCQRHVKTRKLQAYTSFTKENFKVIPREILKTLKASS